MRADWAVEDLVRRGSGEICVRRLALLARVHDQSLYAGAA